MAKAAREAANKLVRVSTDQKNAALLSIAAGLEQEAAFIKGENQKDIAGAEEMGLSSAMLDRLAIKDTTIASMVNGLREVEGLKDPVATMGPTWVRQTLSPPWARRGFGPTGFKLPACEFRWGSLASSTNQDPM